MSAALAIFLAVWMEKADLDGVGEVEGDRAKQSCEMPRKLRIEPAPLYLPVLPVTWGNTLPFLLKLVQLGFCHRQPKYPNTNNYFSPILNDH